MRFSTVSLFFFHCCTVVVVITQATRAPGQIPIGFNDEIADSKLPKPLSDFTATLDRSNNNNVYIAGGCDAKLGNVFVEDYGEFACGSISNKLYSFDASTETFQTLQDLPVARYRHAAAIANGYLWLLGGRHLDETMISQVDVYDIANDSWRTFTDLPAQYHLSDFTAFTLGSEIFFAGGYNFTYRATANVFSINTASTLEQNATVITPRAPISYARGDLTSTTDDDQTYAVVSGGFSSVNDFCNALAVVDKYDAATETWSTLPPLNYERGDKALVDIDGYLYALGGETNIVDYCANNKTSDPGEKTVAVDAVDVFDGKNWTAIEDLPDNRFRFQAVAIGSKIYSFGGQDDYNSSCMCYRTTDEVVIYTEQYFDQPNSGATHTMTLWSTCSMAIMVTMMQYSL